MTTTRIPGEQTARLDIALVGSSVVWGAKLRARREAEELLEQARVRSERIVAEAEARAKGIRQRAAAAGQQAGRRQVAQALAGALRLRERARRAVWPQLVRLACRMAERILRAELAARPEALARMCSEVLREVQLDGDLVIRVHPQDLERLEQSREDLGRRLGVRLHLVPDDGVLPGGLVVVGQTGQVDARLEVQLDQLAAALQGVDDEPAG